LLIFSVKYMTAIEKNLAVDCWSGPEIASPDGQVAKPVQNQVAGLRLPVGKSFVPKPVSHD
jgi:hypothetical protein